MEIQELMIKKYGKFSDYHMTFQPGINIIYGGNETGKTTIHSFIKAMFFGLNRGRGRAARMDEYQIRQPWDSPGAFLGSMRIREDGNVYRIDRCFDRSGIPLGLVCETKQLESEHPQEDLDALLGGISESAFINSVFVSQMHCETDETLAQELQRYMINSGSSMDGEIDVTRALQSLRKKKKQLEQQKKKEEEDLEKKIAQKQEKADQLRRELELLEQQAVYFNESPAGRGSGGRNLPNRDAPGAEEKSGWIGSAEEEEQPDRGISPLMYRLLCTMLVLAGALTMGGAFLTEGASLRLFLGVMTALFWMMAIGVHALFPPHAGSYADNGEEHSGVNSSDSELSFTSGTECPPELLKEIRGRQEAYRKLKEELEFLYQQHVQPSMEVETLTLAIDRICDISDRIFRENGGRLNEIASEILEEITCGRYNRIVMDDTAEVRIHTPSRVLSLNQVSSGTMQQIYFALRMAAGELLTENQILLPVLLDETFAMYDDHRLEATLRWLKKSGRQVILFTCQSREREILKRL
ncbi:MAG: AAA family ATPase [Lachnospiraceae bacterium]|nr:AAA family ATPase [Lachnospiraceae bacterium]